MEPGELECAFLDDPLAEEWSGFDHKNIDYKLIKIRSVGSMESV